jgi:transcription antitermination factor NusG
MNWYAIYTKSRCEKKVHTTLLQKGIESYCPTTIVKKQWTDRVKKIKQPLFTSYLFVKITIDQQQQIRETAGVVNFVYWLGKPAQIKAVEIEAIKNFVKKNEIIFVEKFSYTAGQFIDIEEGVFKGQKAIINKIFKNKVELILPALQLKLVTPIKQTTND